MTTVDAYRKEGRTVDVNGRIYESDDVPAEDRARLDGYLRGRAEADLLEDAVAMRERLREIEQEAERAD